MQRTKIVKLAKVCKIISKVLYFINCAACTVFIILAVVLPLTNAIKSITPAECAIVFTVLALYAFFLFGLMWNVEGIFKSIEENKTPFCERATHYLKKSAIFILIVSIVPSLVGLISIKLCAPGSIFDFHIEVVGVCSAIVLFLIGTVMNYGCELQKRDDETL